jgi:hypothetical protein
MSNPYQAPVRLDQNPPAQTRLRGPAIALIVVSAFALVLGSLALLFDVYLLASGTAERLEANNAGPVSEHTQIIVRSIWGALLIVASAFVLYGAMQMLSLKNYKTARMAAVVAMIPMVGPCCFIGIPFGIWAFVALGDPNVRSAFR